MSYEDKKTTIEKLLAFQAGLFNPRYAPRQASRIQFTFREPEGDYHYYLAVEGQVCRVESGTAPQPLCWTVTDVETWLRVGGGYLSGAKAMRTGKLSFKKGTLWFLRHYGRMFGGRTDVPIREGTYLDPILPDQIKRVLILSCSHRDKKGVTQLFVERLQKGMESAGAEVTTLFPSKMAIHPCCGQFQCWRDRGKGCVHKNDDMSLFWAAYKQTDLLVWATPIYTYFGSSAMKKVMERLFANVDHRIVVRGNRDTHPCKTERVPYHALLGTCGFADSEMFEPLIQSLRILTERRGTKLIAELVRPSCMGFMIDEPHLKTKDDALEALEKAGEAMVLHKSVDRKIVARVKQPTMSRPMMTSAANYYLDNAIDGTSGEFVFERPIDE